MSEPNVPETKMARIPRPRNKWILYRQYQAAIIRQDLGKITASEMCMFGNFHRRLYANIVQPP